MYPPAYAEIASTQTSNASYVKRASTAEHYSNNFRQEVQIIYLNKASRRINDLCW